MTFEFENLGTIKKATIEMGNLTVICGKNNTGKTYLTYAVWSFLSGKLSYVTMNEKRFENINKEAIASLLDKGHKCSISIKDLLEDFKLKFSQDISEYEKQLDEIFDAPKGFFSNSKVKGYITETDIYEGVQGVFGKVFSAGGNNDITLEYKHIKGTDILELSVDKKRGTFDVDILQRALGFIDYQAVKDKSFLITAQRESLPLFKNAINENARYTMRNNRKKNLSYALALEAEIDFASALGEVEKYDSFLKESPLIKEVEDMLKVKYIISNNEFIIQHGDSIITPSYLASTSVRTLADLHFYLKHTARKGDLLMIDEPELNLHPENQIKIARLLIKLVNAGIKVWITTHSDYIVKELNNCLMLSRDFAGKEEMMQELGYKPDETLKADDLRVYIADNGTVERVEYDEYGMLKSSFDDAMNQQNYNANTISRKIKRSL